MFDYQREFLDFALVSGVLRFGSFQLKSGRTSPYFFDAGLFNRGRALARLGRFYAHAILQSGVAFDLLYGPAYKGIPLVATASIAFADHHGRDVPYAFNRKEAKDHGEGGAVVGGPLAGEVLILDDVMTSGKSVHESVAVIRAHGASPAGAVIALDREERGRGARSAVEQVRSDYGFPVISIVTLSNLIEFLASDAKQSEFLRALRDYHTRYGVRASVP